MKTNLVRLFVVTLALAGFGATTVSARTSKLSKNTTPKTAAPMCVPSDPSLCGLH